LSYSQWYHLYNNERWRKRRRFQLMKEPWCAICKERNIATPATVADHVVPHNGDLLSFWTGDLQSLCKPHHDGSKKEIEFKGYCSDVGVDGWPLDPQHHANNRDALRMRNKPRGRKYNVDLLG
jgi:5-methylcytosine-specific restriction enzyme A